MVLAHDVVLSVFAFIEIVVSTDWPPLFLPLLEIELDHFYCLSGRESQSSGHFGARPLPRGQFDPIKH